MFTKRNAMLRLVMILLLPAFAATAAAQDGKISLRDKRMSAGEVIRSVEEQTGYKFSYTKTAYDTTRYIDLSDSPLALRELLDIMVDGAGVNYMVRGQHIALVPANDNSRPQVRRQTPDPRTSDVYVRNRPGDVGTASVPRPVAETAVPAPLPEPVEPEPAAQPQPEPEQYSDYRPIDIYGNVQRSLPRFAVKINLLYGLATLTPNISLEAALSRRSTLALSYSSNPWKYKADLADNKKLLHGIAGLEYRYWFCERYSGHSIGARAFYSEYNVGGHDIPLLFDKEYRYKGNAFGAGVFYGYSLPVGRMWNIEFTAGVNVLRMDYDRYGCRTCDTNSRPFKKTRPAPSAGINLVFLIR